MVETICFYLQNLTFESPKPTTEQGKKKDKLQKKWENVCSFSKKTKREYIYGKVYTLTHLKKKKKQPPNWHAQQW